MSTPTTLVADRYRLVKLLGVGGMGIVWQAWDERLQRPVALKMLRSQPELTDSEREAVTNRAMREARITAGLHHPHAVTVFDVVEHEGQPCLVLQLIESTPLSVLLREHGTLTPRETARIGAQVSSALAAAHKMRIVHRDVKPGNILITEDGSAMISDFGISHALGDTTITATGMIHGTPAYLAPEVARGQESSFASDVFSLGSTLYAMLEGVPPFGAENNAIALLHKVARASYPAPKHAGKLKPLLREMLSADPKSRPNMTSVAARLTDLYEGTRAARATGATMASDLPTVPLGRPPAASGAGGPPAVAAVHDEVEAMAETERPDVAPAGFQQFDRATMGTDFLEQALAEAARSDEATAQTRRMGEVARGETEREHHPNAVAAPISETKRYEAAAAAAATAEEERSAAAPAPAAAARGVLNRPTGRPVDAPRRDPEPLGRRHAGVLLGILLLLGGLVLGVVFQFGPLLQDASNAGGPGAKETPTSRETSATETPSPNDTPVATEPPAETQPPETQATPVPSPSAPEEDVDEEQPAPTGPVETITTYYSLMPDDLDAGWPMMTADYQVNHVGGRDAYEAFWDEVEDLAIADVTSSAPDRAQATLTYYFTDGRVVREVTAYRLAEEAGALKIAATSVLSSVGL
ncbi:MAG TPA: protein kinase [Glaciibacter sp.]|nr:protein kinase [Glaciibacter sp.]